MYKKSKLLPMYFIHNFDILDKKCRFKIFTNINLEMEICDLHLTNKKINSNLLEDFFL